MGPIDYTSTYQPIDIGRQFLGGLQAGAAIGTIENTAEKQRLALEQQRQYQIDARSAIADGSPRAVAAFTLKYPAQSETVKKAFDGLEEGERKQESTIAQQSYSALLAGDNDTAINVIQKARDARANSGLDTSHYDNALDLVKKNPQEAKGSVGLWLAHITDPKSFSSSFGGLGTASRAAAEAPADLAIKRAAAAKGGAEAVVAEATVPAEIQAATEKNLSSEAKRRIDELNVQIGQADSETKRGQLVLERDKLVSDQAKNARELGLKETERGDSAQSQIDGAQRALDTIKELRSDPAAKDTAGNWLFGPGTLAGRALSVIPGTENMDYKAKIESLKSQVFLPAVQQLKGMGALSNAEGEKLSSAIATLSSDMSPKARDNAIGVIERYMQTALQKGLANKSVPVQGGGFVTNHPTFGTVKEGDINRLMKQYPGATRDQVMQFLNQGGK